MLGLSPSTHSSPLTDGRDDHDLTADDFATALRVLRAAPTLAEDDADLVALKWASRNDRPSAWAASPKTSGGASERMEMEIGGLVMVFQGEVLSVGALLDVARSTPEAAQNTRVGLRHTAAQNAASCRAMLAIDEPLDACWRFGILQTLDDYTSASRRGGPDLAAGVFTDEPPHTGSVEIDAAFAALAEHLAERDGWPTPAWASDPSRRTTAWYPSVPAIFHADADRESPEAFRRRGILITSRSLSRA